LYAKAALFMITLSWLHSPPTLEKRSNNSLQTYYFAIFINSMPVVIMGAFALQVFRQQNKVFQSFILRLGDDSVMLVRENRIF